jgi:hypothetical protein
MPGEEAPTTPIILCCPYYKKSAFYNISTVVSIENLARTLPLAGPVAFPSSAAVSIPHPLQTVIKSRTSQKGVFRISGTLVKATPPKKKMLDGSLPCPSPQNKNKLISWFFILRRHSIRCTFRVRVTL